MEKKKSNYFNEIMNILTLFCDNVLFRQQSELITKLDMYMMQFIKIDEFSEICRSVDINEFNLR